MTTGVKELSHSSGQHMLTFMHTFACLFELVHPLTYLQLGAIPMRTQCVGTIFTCLCNRGKIASDECGRLSEPGLFTVHTEIQLFSNPLHRDQEFWQY